MNAHVDPADLPLPSVAEWVCTQALQTSRRQIDAINDLSKPTIEKVRGIYRKYIERSLAKHLSSNEYLILGSIVTRTLAYSKLIEVIPQSVFMNGIRQPGNSNAFVLDELGMPLYEGTGLDKKTIRKAVEGLTAKGVITTFAVPGKAHAEVFAYSAMSLRNFFASLRDLQKGDASQFFDLTKHSVMLSMAFMRDPAHELEQNFTKLFPHSLKVINENKKLNEDVFANNIKRSLVESFPHSGGEIPQPRVKFPPTLGEKLRP